ncbi:MAG: TIGR02391 family protein [Chloroflexi bacterium RBG_13_52_14]|nr:MAG: TIGR02391 family protein [Chloroflexi bacterium RBG_13_52_14]
MARTLKEIFPPPEEALNLEPEELAIYILQLLDETGDSGIKNLHNFTLHGNLQQYLGERTDLYKNVAKVITEAWVWLQREGLIAPEPGKTNWIFVTRKGKRLLSASDLQTYKNGYLLPEQVLDPVLARKVRPLFLRGDYDTAVFQAFKEVEIRVRASAHLPDELCGVKLMRQAFDSDKGPLAETSLADAERQAMASLFAGAIGLFKNPASHRDINLEDPLKAAELIFFANHLLRIVDKCAQKDKH